MGYEESYPFNMPLTLEKHFERLAESYPGVKELHSLWILLKERIEKHLSSSRGVFVTYSLHDESHSRSIIHIIERFLGEERIKKLSATDTYMLLVCAYAHDYGMAQTANKIYEILGSPEFESFLKDIDDHQYELDNEDAKAVKNLLFHLNENKPNIPLKEMYNSITFAIQLYLRQRHWKDIGGIKENFQGLFKEHVKGRFVQGSEGIIEICMCHGQSFHSLFHLSQRSNGIVGDEFHPRFIAAMLRLGDLLDLDNSRFPYWFGIEVDSGRKFLPARSVAHFRKHESISHVLITNKRIEIRADCKSNGEDCEEADLVSQWTNLLAEECRQLVTHWNEIVQPDFGRPPSNLDIRIFVDGKPYESSKKELKMEMSQERVMSLLEGTSIYRNKYVGIREIIQNAVDASLLQMWTDIIQNQYLSYGLSKDAVKDGLNLLDLDEKKRIAIFGNYNITVEVIRDKKEKKVFVVVKDKGIGITKEDVPFLSEIGSSKEKNMRLLNLASKMPPWLKPSGVFGIGLQSVFQLTDRIDFYTRLHNMPERKISLYSYGKNRGKVVVNEVPSNEDGMYFENSIPGTNVKFAIEPRKLLGNKKGKIQKDSLVYYDPEFDTEDELDMIFAEISRACEDEIKSSKSDYFNIFFRTIRIDENGKDHPSEKKCLRRSYFYVNKSSDGAGYKRHGFGENFNTVFEGNEKPFSFINNMAYYWDEEACRCYWLTLRPCTIQETGGVKKVYLPKPVPNLYEISYKFNKLSDATAVYRPWKRIRNLHAGFLKWRIEILDDNPTRYLNIDRDRLREGALYDDELLEVRQKILERWCDFFSSGWEKAPIGEEKNRNGLKRQPAILLSLILLFYQSVSEERFQKFIQPYQSFVEELNLVLGDGEIPITYLWDSKRLFRAEYGSRSEEVDLPRKFLSLLSEYSFKEATKISCETVSHLPHRLVHINEIFLQKDLKLTYQFYLHMPGDEPYPIQMTEAAKLYDYMKLFDPHLDRPVNLDCASIQKKVLKPDADYPHLLLPCYPHTFRQGRNFGSNLDRCIRWYILSPFDKDAANIIRKGLESKEGVSEEILNTILEELIETVSNSRQAEKCIRYIIQKRYNENWQYQEKIQSEYRSFVRNFGKIIFNRRAIVTEQFQVKK